MFESEKISTFATYKSAGIDFRLNANTIKGKKEVVHLLYDLDYLEAFNTYYNKPLRRPKGAYLRGVIY